MPRSEKTGKGSDEAERHTTGDDEGSGKGEQGEKGKPGKRKLACMSCRDIKAKCLLCTPGSAPQDPCKRCVRLGLECVYTPKRRPTRYERFGGATYIKTDGHSLSRSPAAVTNASITNPINTAINILGNPVDAYSSFSGVLDPSLGAKYGHNAQANPRSATSGIFHAFSNHSAGLGVAGEYDTSATRTSIQPLGMDGGDEPMGMQDEDQPPAIHYPRRNTDYGMSGTRSDSPPAVTLNTLSEPQNYSSTSSNRQHQTLIDHRFDNNGSTPAKAVTGMDLVSELSNLRSSVSGNVLSTGGHEAYRLPSSSARYYNAAPGEFGNASSPRSMDRNGQLVNNSTSSNSINQYQPPSLSMIVHGPAENSRSYRTDVPNSLTESSRVPERRNTSSPRNARSEITQTTSTGFAPQDSAGQVVTAERYDAMRGDREETEESRGGMDWMVEMQKRGGYAGTECPITLGLVTEDQVRFLFDKYHNKLNTYVGLLDPSLHTIHYVRSRSPILMTAICCATSQAYLPERYPLLLARAKFMIERAFGREEVNLPLCQALSILSVWKDGIASTDRGAWLKVGQAIRIGYYMGLDKAGPRPLPQDEFEARQIIDRERAWRQLSAFDRSMQHSYGASSRMIPNSSAQEVEKWLLDHPSVVCESDAMQACSATIGFILLTLSTHNKTAEDDQLHRFVLHNIQNDLDAWKEKWLGDHPPAKLHPTSRVIVGFYGVCVSFDIAVFKRRCFQRSGSHSQLIMEAANAAITVLEYIVNSLVPEDVLSFAPDIVPVKAARSAVFLVTHFSSIEPAMAIKVISLIQEIADQFLRHSRGRDTAHYQHKFFSRLLSIASPGATRQASRRPSPGPGEVDGGPANPALPTSTSVNLDEPVSAANLVQHINFSLNPGQQDHGQGNRDIILGDQALMDSLLLQAQDWFPLDLFTDTGGLV
ncbi:hypothetical protein QFC22_006177 [Naganishia vaughanmartiniae]|uniref:Uncharacterized protein n=1 Tax=Naganishia vaughanmartiniae TaxID=1424756 RepID=A0ACC2WLP8_9TREE|nr:hypothetical protein QFC22_006177 [Naganishia vaughanmartiniae]